MPPQGPWSLCFWTTRSGRYEDQKPAGAAVEQPPSAHEAETATTSLALTP
jgi:hypothetical protein